ncbi:MAG: APC family permease [Salinigranum sp.]
MSDGPPSFRQDLGFYSLLAMSLGTVIGSGWLLLPGIVASAAGPAAVVSWLLGGVAILVVALVFAELGAAWPAPGAVAKYPYLSHGPFAGHMAGWAAFVAYAIIPPAEAVAVVRYASTVVPSLGEGARLSTLGLLLAVVILALVGLLNYVGVRYLAIFENYVTALKYVPIVLFVVLAGLFAFHPENFSAFGGFAPNGSTGVLLGTSSTVFAYLGFRQALDFGSEAKDPGRTLPRAVVATVLIATATYALISVVFVGALDWGALASSGVAAGDWSTLAALSAPVYTVVSAAGLGLLATLLLADGVVSPNGPNATNVGAVPRLAYSMAEDGTMPAFFLRLHPQYGTPGAGLLVSFVLEVGFLLVTVGGYSELISAVNVGFIVSYAIGPVAMGALRRTAPHVERPFRLPAGRVLSPLAFVLASLLLFWESWPLTGEMLGVLLTGVAVYAYYVHRGTVGTYSLRHGVWLVAYLLAMAAVSYLGDPQFGGAGVLPFGWDFLVVAVVSLGFYYWGVRRAIPYDEAREPGSADVAKTGDAPAGPGL